MPPRASSSASTRPVSMNAQADAFTAKAVAMAQMRLPVGGGDAVLDQRVGGGGVRNAQQRLGEAEQRDAFRRAEAVFRRKSVTSAPGRCAARAARTSARARASTRAARAVQRGGVQQRRETVRRARDAGGASESGRRA